MAFAPVNGIDLYYELHGRPVGEAEAIVFAHGAGGNHLSWWQQVPAFMDRYTCLVFDHRGFGHSRDAEDSPGWGGYVADLTALLDHVGIERSHLVAQSMGGWTCLGFALQHPERVDKLVMADTHGGTVGPEIPEWTPSGAAPDPATGFHPACGATMLREQPALNFLYWQVAANNPPREGLLASMRKATPPATENVKRLAVPALFIIGEEDIVIPPEVVAATAALVPGARVARVPSAGHSVYWERAATFNSLVDSFLNGP